MPSPFPGMDPYLEDQRRWQDVHHALVAALRADMNRLLPAGYAASVELRIYTLPPGRSVYPDIVTSVVGPPRPMGSRSGTAAVALADPPTQVRRQPAEIREPYVQIIALGGGVERIVACVEVLSPANKASSGEGRAQYLAKQRSLLASDVHLVEIDLLRAGEPTIAASLAAGAEHDYAICLSRANSDISDTWAVGVRQRLPRFLLPLLPDEGELVVDLQASLNRAYDEGAFARRIDYSADPVPPLDGDDAAWADALLREKGLRS